MNKFKLKHYSNVINPFQANITFLYPLKMSEGMGKRQRA